MRSSSQLRVRISTSSVSEAGNKSSTQSHARRSASGASSGLGASSDGAIRRREMMHSMAALHDLRRELRESTKATGPNATGPGATGPIKKLPGPLRRATIHCLRAAGRFNRRCVATMRSEQTVVHLIRPPDDADEKLRIHQMVQLFWNALASELFICCLFYNEDDDEGDQREGSRGRRSGGASSGTASSSTHLNGETFIISPVESLTQGLIASLITLSIITMCAYIFKWGNSRRRKPSATKKYLTKAYRAWRLMRARARGEVSPEPVPVAGNSTSKPLHVKAADGTTQCEERSELTQLGKLIIVIGCLVCPGFHLMALCLCRRRRRVAVAAAVPANSEMCGSTDGRHQCNGSHQTSPTSSPTSPRALLGDGCGEAVEQPEGYRTRVMSPDVQSTPVLPFEEMMTSSARGSRPSPPSSPPPSPSSAPPPSQPLALRCAATSMPTGEGVVSAGAAGDEGESTTVSSQAVTTSISTEAGVAVTIRLARRWRGQASNAVRNAAYSRWSAETVRSKVAHVQRLKVAQRSCGRSEAERKAGERATARFLAVSYESQLRHRVEEMAWRPECEYRTRFALAWACNLASFLMFVLVSIIYAAEFGETKTKKMLISWLISYGVTFAVIEPLQVLLIACSPCFFDPNTRCGRVGARCRFVYNEILAP